MNSLSRDRTDAGALRLAPAFHLAELSKSEHFVQFYEDDSVLVKSVAEFISAGLSTGENAIVIATKAHREALEERLQRAGVDLAAARRNCQYIPLDAAETLSKFMVEGVPHEALFRDVIGGLVARTTQSGKGLRAFGEMVALLVANGNTSAAIQLEGLWNNLAKSYPFSLFCAYPMHDFCHEADGQPFKHICNAHTRVVPLESYTNHAEADERLRTVTVLQQKAAALE